jgi:hypothetical protein
MATVSKSVQEGASIHGRALRADRRQRRLLTHEALAHARETGSTGLGVQIESLESDKFASLGEHLGEQSQSQNLRRRHGKGCSDRYDSDLAINDPGLAGIFVYALHRAPCNRARMAKLVDARDLKSLDRKVMSVRFRLRAPQGSFRPSRHNLRPS